MANRNSKIKITDVLNAARDIISLYADDGHFNSISEIAENLKNEPEFTRTVKNLGAMVVPNIITGVVLQYYMQKHQVEQYLTQYLDFNVDSNGQPIRGKRNHLVLDYLTQKNKHDAEIVSTTLSSGLIAKMRQRYFKTKALELEFPQALANRQETEEALRNIYIDFHLKHAASHAHQPDYAERLGEYYYQVGKVLGDNAKAMSFITTNFNKLIKPPKNSEQYKPYVIPNNKQVATAIRNVAKNRKHYHDMANCFASRKDIPATLHEHEPVSVTQEQQAITITEQPVRQKRAYRKSLKSTALVNQAAENKFDVISITPQQATALDHTIELFGGISNTQQTLAYMQQNNIGATRIVEQQQEKKEAKKILDMLANLPDGIRQIVQQEFSQKNNP